MFSCNIFLFSHQVKPNEKCNYLDLRFAGDSEPHWSVGHQVQALCGQTQYLVFDALNSTQW